MSSGGGLPGQGLSDQGASSAHRGDGREGPCLGGEVGHLAVGQGEFGGLGVLLDLLDAGGTREVEVASGSHFYSEGTDWHEVLNIGDSTAVYLIIEPK